MDFQLARNLSALSRAQNEIAESLLHIDCLSDCLNREIIMSAASSEATEQLVASARTTLVQVQNMLAAQSDEGAQRLREAQVAFIATCRERSSSTSVSHESVPGCQDWLEPDHQVSGRLATVGLWQSLKPAISHDSKSRKTFGGLLGVGFWRTETFL